MYAFFFVLVVLPYLIFTGAVFISFLARRTRTLGIILICLICFPLLLIAAGWLSRPTEPDKSDIIGQYEIDRSKFPGKQADWQHATYSLEITANRVIVRDSRTETTWESSIEWFHQPEYRWKFVSSSKRHHIIADGPALYREPFGYHYVFKSPLYGDVFFRKK